MTTVDLVVALLGGHELGAALPAEAGLGAERGAAGEAVARDAVAARGAPAPLLAIAVDLAEAGVDVAHRLVEEGDLAGLAAA